ncbi:MAG: hypothetical protein IKL65_02005 [Bacilli bacterium]|nr:hypothetical protein [Bacilli bacterium]
MLKTIDITKEQLDKITSYIIEEKTEESTVHPFIEGNKKKVFKFFKPNIDIDNKTKKIKLLDKRLNEDDNVVKAESLVRYNGKIIGYTMPLVYGQMFNPLSFNREKNIQVLKEISKILKKLHTKGIICADIVGNVIVTSEGKPYLIDYDNFAIDGLPVDTKNIFLQRYENKVKTFDEKFDNYMLNIFTISIINRTAPYYLFNRNGKDYPVKDKAINDIIIHTLDLANNYDDNAIVDKINSKKDLKKIKLKKF